MKAVLILILVAVVISPTGALALPRTSNDSDLTIHPLGNEFHIEDSRVPPSTPSASGAGNVTWTLCLWNNTLLSGNAVCPYTVVIPLGIAWDSTNGDIYLTNQFSNNVSVVDGNTNRVVAAIPVGSQPVSVAYDSGNGYIYVANTASNNVSVIDGSTNSVLANIRVGSGPQGAAYDGENGYIYITNLVSNNVSVINGGT